VKTVDIIYRYNAQDIKTRPLPSDSLVALLRLNRGNRDFAALLDHVEDEIGVQQIIQVDPCDLRLVSGSAGVTKQRTSVCRRARLFGCPCADRTDFQRGTERSYLPLRNLQQLSFSGHCPKGHCPKVHPLHAGGSSTPSNCPPTFLNGILAISSLCPVKSLLHNRGSRDVGRHYPSEASKIAKLIDSYVKA